MGHPGFQGTLYKFMSGDVAEPARSTAKRISAHFGFPFEAMYSEAAATEAARALGILGPHEQVTTPQFVRETLAHTLSLPPFTVAHKQITWGDLVKELPERFVLPLRDEALAPAYAAGTKGIFSTTAEAKPNKIVLVADVDGNHYVRRIAERRIGQWQAVADGPGFQPLDFEADRLRVVAVMVGHEWE
jgi:hypothetical protein